MADRLAEIRERWNLAINGPWTWRPTAQSEETRDHLRRYRLQDNHGLRIGVMDAICKGDAEAIAAAPADIAYLLEVADAARALVERMDLEGHQGDCCDRHGGYWLPEGDYIHAPDCPWLRARGLLAEGERERV